MNKIIYSLLFCSALVFAENELVSEEEAKNAADCLILEDENSIICKYLHERLEEDKEIIVKWVDPQGEISRERTLIIPAGHGSIYDFRYIEGREKGIWQFKVLEDGIETSATFQLE